MEILTTASMQEVELYTINNIGLSQDILMEKAGLSFFQECLAKVPKEKFKKIAIFAGRGSNGGDGFVIGRLLVSAGYDTTIYQVSRKDELSELTQKQKKVLSNLNIKVVEINKASTFPAVDEYTLIIDALVGTGLKGELDTFLSTLVQHINKCDAYKVSVDIPSGLNASNNNVPGDVFLADLTVTFCRSKVCHNINPAKAYCGEVSIVDIGIPEQVLRLFEHTLFKLTENNTPSLPMRKPYGHKGNYGHVLVIGGSLGKSGAAIMASLACLRAGAGLVTTMLPIGCKGYITQYIEIMSIFGKGTDHFIEEDAQIAIDFAENKSVIVIGPGLGRDENTFNFIRKVIQNTKVPVIVDADALMALDELTLKALKGRGILTPHLGEFSHITKMDKSILDSDRLRVSQKYALKKSLYLILKSSETVISTPDGDQYVSAWGTPALSKGGSGDILTGIIGALVAQGYNLLDSAKLGLKMLGMASVMEQRADFSVMPLDIIKNIGREI